MVESRQSRDSSTRTGARRSAAQDTSTPSNGFVGRVRERAGEQLSMQKDRASDGIGVIVRAVRRTAQELRDADYDGVAEYVDRGAAQVERLSQQLRHKDVGDLFRDAQRAARRRPAIFIGSAFAVGLLAARFLKSSSPQPERARATTSGRGMAKR